ncbi:hypothetical protein HN371_05735 [Candidatus Poribacteria bacterium]|jgi:hypothetical protein|nr:hypothetical protein [Candidatus Poribacteria bacterium]MBT5533807.1 hypothetical protein [Candidatus Poribacteria bacterium]MBT7101352.1 hypothetical protein [Candidatus Poribacteria bacterium]MBT7806284.1 hypothetical protein [Candidatus Poribacteria bacterium]
MSPNRIVRLGALALGLALPIGLLAQSTVTGVSRASNPAISANVLYLADTDLRSRDDADPAGRDDHEPAADVHSHGSDESLGARVQEFELRLTSFVDPHVKADITLSTHGVADAELEEAFVTTLGLPGDLALKAGKFLGAFGKQNPLHTHQFPLVERPLAHDDLFGEEGLNEVGVEVSWLAPVDWFLDVVGGVYNGDNPGLFHSEDEEEVAFLGRFRNLVDLNDETTLEVGGSGLTGRNEESDTRSNVVGADVTLKWSPLETQRYKALTLQAEYLRGDVQGEVREGAVAHAQFRLSRHWWVQGAGDWLTEDDHTTTRVRALVAYVPTEFQTLRLQYGATSPEDADTEHRVSLQYNFTIGSHPAHAY